MWLITSDCCGLFCAIFTYFTVVFVYIGFIRIGIWEDIQEGRYTAALHFMVFQYHCFMIFWSHWKTMTTQPGLLPYNVDTLNYKKLDKKLCNIIDQIGRRMKKLETLIKQGVNAQKPIGMEIMDKTDLLHLNRGAEMTESDDDYGADECRYERRRDKISSSMQRSIDRLLGCTIDTTGRAKEGGENESIIDANGKITFDRRLYDFDTY